MTLIISAITIIIKITIVIVIITKISDKKRENINYNSNYNVNSYNKVIMKMMMVIALYEIYPTHINAFIQQSVLLYA